jgi:hypothetical protein
VNLAGGILLQKIPEKGVTSPGIRPANKNNSTGRLHANFVALAKNLTERERLRARKNQDSLTPTSAILSVYAAAQSASTIPEESITVLPFENRREEKANAYFADGIQDEILTRLMASSTKSKQLRNVSAAC